MLPLLSTHVQVHSHWWHVCNYTHILGMVCLSMLMFGCFWLHRLQRAVRADANNTQCVLVTATTPSFRASTEQPKQVLVAVLIMLQSLLLLMQQRRSVLKLLKRLGESRATPLSLIVHAYANVLLVTAVVVMYLAMVVWCGLTCSPDCHSTSKVFCAGG